MTRITALGATGYADGHIVREDVARGHEETPISRMLPAEPVDGVPYRTGGDVLLVAEDGTSTIFGDDYAFAFLDEIQRPTHRRERFMVAY